MELEALTTTFIAAFLAYIAYNNHRLEKAKIKLELFNRRMEVCEAIYDINREFGRVKPNREDIGPLMKILQNAPFLFSGTAERYVEEFFNVADEAWWALEELEGAKVVGGTKEYEARNKLKLLLIRLNRKTGQRNDAMLTEMHFNEMQSRLPGQRFLDWIDNQRV